MKTFWIIGYEPWHIRPAKKWDPQGRCWLTLAWGLWLRWPKDDTGPALWE